MPGAQVQRGRLQGMLLLPFRWLLGIYPSEQRAEFGEEMETVYALVLTRAARQGRLELLAAAARELGSLPWVIVRLYAARRRTWFSDLKTHGASWFRDQAGSLPPPDKDGRSSWRQAFLEAALFIGWGGLLLWQVYIAGRLPLPGSFAFGAALAICAALVLPAGVWRGLPRWAFPAAGLLVGYGAAVAARSGWASLYLLWLVCVLALWAVSVRVHLQTGGIEDAHTLRIATSIFRDPSRWAFAVYGLTPLLLLAAYDHSYLPGRTAALAVSVAGMLLGALVFSRSRSAWAQAASLAVGLTLALAPAFWELTFLSSGAWPRHLAWMVQVWVGPLALMLVPFLFGSQGRLANWVLPRGYLNDN